MCGTNQHIWTLTLSAKAKQPFLENVIFEFLLFLDCDSSTNTVTVPNLSVLETRITNQEASSQAMCQSVLQRLSASHLLHVATKNVHLHYCVPSFYCSARLTYCVLLHSSVLTLAGEHSLIWS